MNKVIQQTKYKNIDIIVGGETLKKSLIVMRELYDNNNFYLIGIKIYQSNNGSGSYKGILDLNNNLDLILSNLKMSKPKIKILFNGVIETENKIKFQKWLKEINLYDNLLSVFIKHSENFTTSENYFISIWENHYYWRQKQAYEELIA